MNGKVCPREGCGASLRVREATEMPTQYGNGFKTVLDVRYCDNGHIHGYHDRQEPCAAPPSEKQQTALKFEEA